MTKEKMQHGLLYILLIVTVLIGLLILSPYFEVVFMAAMFAILLSPLHRMVEMLMRGKKMISALVTTIIVMLIVLIPISLVGFQVFQEAKQVYVWFVHNTLDIGVANTFLERYAPQIAPAFSSDINQYIAQGLQWIVSNLSAVFSSIAGILIEFFLMLFVLFFMFKDGSLFRKMVISISPFDVGHNEELLEKVEEAMASVIKGTLIVAGVQGALAGIGYVLTGVPNPVLWGVVSIFASLIPGVGAGLVIVPAVIFLVMSSNMVGAAILAVWGLVLVGGVDNLLRPMLVGKGTKLHPLVVLLSALGGIHFFGFIGFLVGPIVFSILAALIEIYPRIMREHAEHM